MIEWKYSQKPEPYQAAIKLMEHRVAAIINSAEPEQIWLLEHPPLYTGGTSADVKDLLKNDFPVHHVGRGGEYTYHGPGQRVAYIMLDLKRIFNNKPDLRRFIWMLEEWIIQTLAKLDVKGERRDGRVGIWVSHDNTESKIAAIGIRIRKWISFHGISINVNPDLSHFNGIVPCGINEYGVTSLHKLGVKCDMNLLDKLLEETYYDIFGQ